MKNAIPLALTLILPAASLAGEPEKKKPAPNPIKAAEATERGLAQSFEAMHDAMKSAVANAREAVQQRDRAMIAARESAERVELATRRITELEKQLESREIAYRELEKAHKHAGHAGDGKSGTKESRPSHHGASDRVENALREMRADIEKLEASLKQRQEAAKDKRDERSKEKPAPDESGEVAKLRKQLEEANQRLAESEKSRGVGQNELKAMATARQSVLSELSKARKELEDLQKVHRTHVSDTMETRKIAKIQADKVAQMTAQLAEATKARQSAEEKLKESEAARQKLEKELKDLKSRDRKPEEREKDEAKARDRKAEEGKKKDRKAEDRKKEKPEADSDKRDKDKG